MKENFYHPRNLALRHSGSDSATVLRGIGCVMVFLIHSGGAGLRTIFPVNTFPNAMFNWVVDLGSTGPQVFFLASGYALSRSCSSRPTSIIAFGIKRYFRLVPLYSTILIAMFLARWPTSNFGFTTFVRQISFADGLCCESLRFDPTGVSWTMSIEFICSFIVALIVFKQTNLKRALSNHLFFLSCFSFLSILMNKNSFIFYDYHNKYFINYIFLFILGSTIFTFESLIAKNMKLSIIQKYLIALAIPSLAWALRSPSAIFAVGLSVLFLCYFQIGKMGKVKFGVVGIYLGTICFGVYLLHTSFLMLASKFGLNNDFFTAVIGFLFSVTASSFLYLSIERPGILLGTKIADKIEKRNIIPT